MQDGFQGVEIEKHITIGVNYVECDTCQKPLKYKVDNDIHGDLSIYVEPHQCKDE